MSILSENNRRRLLNYRWEISACLILLVFGLLGLLLYSRHTAATVAQRQQEAALAQKNAAEVQAQALARQAKREEEEKLRLVKNEQRIAQQKAEARDRAIHIYIPAKAELSQATCTSVIALTNAVENVDLENAVGNLLNKGAPLVSLGVFTKAFAESAIWQQYLRGNSYNQEDFSPTLYAAKVLSVEEKHTVGSPDPSTGLIQAHLNRTIRLVQLQTARSSKVIAIEVQGIGYTANDALKLAFERAESEMNSQSEEIIQAIKQ